MRRASVLTGVDRGGVLADVAGRRTEPCRMRRHAASRCPLPGPADEGTTP